MLITPTFEIPLDERLMTFNNVAMSLMTNVASGSPKLQTGYRDADDVKHYISLEYVQKYLLSKKWTLVPRLLC